MSDVELFYYAIEKHFRKTSIPWNQLHPMQQVEFIRAVNVILDICANSVVFKDEDVV